MCLLLLLQVAEVEAAAAARQREAAGKNAELSSKLEAAEASAAGACCSVQGTAHREWRTGRHIAVRTSSSTSRVSSMADSAMACESQSCLALHPRAPATRAVCCRCCSCRAVSCSAAGTQSCPRSCHTCRTRAAWSWLRHAVKHSSYRCAAAASRPESIVRSFQRKPRIFSKRCIQLKCMQTFVSIWSFAA